MNPPSALQGAMSRDRKPFTYTPGGLDLSEIKSSRMAARLMRNAMNEGVPEQPKQSPAPVSSTSIAVPNYNCLPVQVFPSFNLPANPKSLLRTRSTPGQSREPRDPPMQRVPPPQAQSSQFVNNSRTPGAAQYDTFNKNTPPYSQINNNRPVSMFEYGTPANTYTPINYGSDGYKTNAYPEISYEADYLCATPKNNNNIGALPPVGPIKSDNYVDNTFKPYIDNNQQNRFIAPSIYEQYLENSFKPEVEITDSSSRFLETTNKYQDITEDVLKPEIGHNETKFPFSDGNKNKVYSDNSSTFDYDNVKTTMPSSDISATIYKPEIKTKDSAILSDLNSVNQEINVDCFQPPKTTYNPMNEEYTPKELPSVENNNCERLVDNETRPEVEDKVISKNSYGNSEIDVKNVEAVTDFTKPKIEYSTFAPNEDLTSSNNEKKEVTVVKKQVTKKENNVEEQNGSSEQNGDTEVEAVVKLPAKKSAAKTETKVEVTKKTLPDGSIEEVKKTITKTTIDGRTEIKTKTETTIIPKEDDEEEVEEVEEEEEANDNVEEVEEEQNTSKDVEKPKENGQENIIKTEERSETTTTTSKKVVVVQDEQSPKEEEEEEVVEEEVEEEPVTFVIKAVENKEPVKDIEEIDKAQEDEEDVEEEEEEVEKETEIIEDVKKTEVLEKEVQDAAEEEENVEEEVEEEEQYEEAEEKEIATKEETVTDSVNEKKDDDENSPTEIEAKTEQVDENVTEEASEKSAAVDVKDDKQEVILGVTEEKQEIVVEKQEHKEEKKDIHEETRTIKVEIEKPVAKIPLREPSVPLEKVEDVEIKPISLGDFITKTHTENTEIITNVTEKPTGLLTEINRIENIVTVNRTTKTLDHAYENITQQGIPTVKTYFTPHIDKIATSPLPARPYQPVYPPEPTTERRHSLLLERLSVERQMPSDVYQNNYQYNNQTIEQQRQWPPEPQAEVLTVSNVKPSQITNQQWYQQKDNAIYNNVSPSPQPAPAAAPSWTQPKPSPQPLYQPQPQYQPPPSPQPQYQAPLLPQQQPQYQQLYTTNLQENTSSSYQNSYSAYTPKPTNWATNTKPISPIPTIITPSQPNQYSYNTDTTDSYQKNAQQYPSSYVPPPWEQDSTYVAPDTTQNYYQPPPQTNAFSPAPNQGWKPTLPTSKFTKTPPTAYIPPKPNQSFVKPVINVEPPKQPGRKTYYSEYERRYISVPESTYVPGESKFQPQPDPSPAYYYDNNEPVETVEPQWRRELREFTEKSQSQVTTQTNIKPPWEAEIKYAKAPEPSYTPTPTWSQTVRPQSWRERSFESEFVSQEWPKTNTLGRGRPLSSYGKETIPERTRGVSVDRYNPNSYQAPVAAEHPPVQTHTHLPTAPHATGYHNPNVPAYHARASAEPREQISYQQPRNVREARASPFQSRSFKYLQWITGTDD